MFKPDDSKDTFSEVAHQDNPKLYCKFYHDKTGTNAVVHVLDAGSNLIVLLQGQRRVTCSQR
jgi:hypothetical protein